jgi:hypothetical protein
MMRAWNGQRSHDRPATPSKTRHTVIRSHPARSLSATATQAAP